MKCKNCHTEISLSKNRIREYIDCKNCGARHLEKRILTSKGQPWVIFIALFLAIFFGTKITDFLESSFGQGTGKLIAVLLFSGLFILLTRFCSPKYGESEFNLIEKFGNPITKEDVKIVAGIFLAVVIFSIILWRLAFN